MKWKSGEKRKFEDDHVQSFSRLKDCYQKVQKIVSLLLTQTQLSRSISMVIDGKIFEKDFISESKFSNESTPTGQKILPKVPL